MEIPLGIYFLLELFDWQLACFPESCMVLILFFIVNRMKGVHKTIPIP